MVTQMISVGEQTGAMDTIFAEDRGLYGRRSDAAVKTF
jgi:type II secretory pathway component PulF